MAPLKIEHLLPRSRGGLSEEPNLWLSSPLCNRHKADRITGFDPATQQEVPLFNPRLQQWGEHFKWSDDGIQIVGLTATGRATVKALHLDDDPDALIVRAHWVSAGWHPPRD